MGILFLVFSIELALKAHQICDRVKHEYTHDLVNLFKSLNASTQERLEQRETFLQVILEQYRDEFKKMRYLIVDREWEFENVDLLSSVAQEIVKDFEEVHPYAALNKWPSHATLP